MSTLRYHASAAIEDLAVGECVIRRAGDAAGDCWRLWFRVLRATDAQPATYSVPVAPGGTASQSQRRMWGLTRTAAGVWQVSPSINVLVSEEVHPGAHPMQSSLWHETPAIVGVPEPAPFI